jgi:hypothetical protein
MKIIFGECFDLGEEGFFAEIGPTWLSAKGLLFLFRSPGSGRSVGPARELRREPLSAKDGGNFF